MKEQGFNKKEQDCVLEFNTLQAIEEILNLYLQMSKNPTDQYNLISEYESKQRMGVVFFFSYR